MEDLAGSGPPEGYALAYEEAKRALDEQERMEAELRSRAGLLIAAAAITTSFLGSQALRSGLTAAGWLAICCFVLLGPALLVILWPRRDWRFVVNVAALIDIYLEPADGPPLTPALIHRDLALHMRVGWEVNRDRLGWPLRAFRAASVLFVGEVVFWVAALISGLD